MYTVEWGPGALRDFERIGRRAQRYDVERIRRAIASLAEVPRPQGTVKMVGQENAFRIRVGDYRIIYNVEDQEQRIVIVKVAHRATAYR
ncbi:MAG: type toxin-antitoxin system RelE/ParE family toxin [Dehalococcoidia bacterium]|nr:type toxin-antitoxin system RelE/ParE family toxin [Dehalococcoidia bacterium]